MKEISLTILERLESIAKDTKKEFLYNKHTGEWAWCNRSNENSPDDWVSWFPTRFDALVDSVFPYLDSIDDEAFIDAYENN